MSSISEVIHPNRNNDPVLLLSSDRPDLLNFAAVTRVDVVDKACEWEVFSTTSPAAIVWAQLGENLSVTLKFGGLINIIPVGSYTCDVVIYDAGHPNGVVWGTITLTMKGDCEGA